MESGGNRAVAVVVKDGMLLLMRRVRGGEEYYVFPGGRIEPGESPEEAAVRELKEETNLDGEIDRLLCEIDHFDEAYDREYYFLFKNPKGDIALGGPERERMNDDNQYHIEWVELEEARRLTNLRPTKGRERIFTII